MGSGSRDCLQCPHRGKEAVKLNSPGGVIVRSSNVSLAYGKFRALYGVSLSVREGSVHAIIGSNGAGKTSLLNVLAGTARPTEGNVYLRDNDVTVLPAWKRARLGMSRAFQVSHVFDKMTVSENLAIAAACAHRRGIRLLSGASRMEVDIVGDTLRRMGLFSVREVYAGDISQGDRKRLEMGMMVASNIDVLLLDEPTAGLSQYEVGTVLENIVALKGGGKTLILVEHDMDVVFSVCRYSERDGSRSPCL
jgi:branched-chain amino acid transport system ATP-binding protein